MAKVRLLRLGHPIIESDDPDDFAVAVAGIASVVENPAELLAALLLVKEAIESGAERFRTRVGSVEVSVERTEGPADGSG